MKKRQEKKSESLEIRLPYSQKTAFVEACREQGISASEALRAQIDLFVDQTAAPQKPNLLGASLKMIERHKKKTFASLTAIAAAISIGGALPSQADETLFHSFDKNADGVLTAGEISPNDSKIFALLDKDKSGDISTSEFQTNAEMIETIDSIEPGENPGDPNMRVVGIERTTLELNDTDKINLYVQRWTEEVELDASDTEINNVIERLKTQQDDVRTLEELEGLDGKGKIRIIKELKDKDELHTRLELEELAKLRIELSELETLDLDLSDLKQLEELGETDFDIDIEFDDLPDFKDIEAELQALIDSDEVPLGEAEIAEITRAMRELENAREEMAELKEIKRVFVIRRGEGEDEHREVRIERKVEKETTKAE